MGQRFRQRQHHVKRGSPRTPTVGGDGLVPCWTALSVLAFQTGAWGREELGCHLFSGHLLSVPRPKDRAHSCRSKLWVG